LEPLSGFSFQIKSKNKNGKGLIMFILEVINGFNTLGVGANKWMLYCLIKRYDYFTLTKKIIL